MSHDGVQEDIINAIWRPRTFQSHNSKYNTAHKYHTNEAVMLHRKPVHQPITYQTKVATKIPQTKKWTILKQVMSQ